jgi:hypothetical protein
MTKAARVLTTQRRTASSRDISAKSTDPIFAAIANHRKLDRIWSDMAAEADRVGNREAKQDNIDRASDAADLAALRMARTKPRTIAGAAALLDYATIGDITGMFTLGECVWHQEAIENAVIALNRLTRRNRAA